MALKLLEIENELTGPNGAEKFAQYDSVLAALNVRLTDALSRGLVPEEYQRAEALKDANIIARKLLRLAVRDGETSPSGAADIFDKQKRKDHEQWQ